MYSFQSALVADYVEEQFSMQHYTVHVHNSALAHRVKNIDTD